MIEGEREQGRGAGHRRRAGWRELLLALGALTLFFALLEAGLGLAGVEPLTLREDPFVGFAGQAPLYVPASGDPGEPDLVTAPARLDLFNPQRFARRKAPGTYRIFCLGGSTTYGRPYDDATSFVGWLRELLPVAAPGRSWEVINAGGVSYASYRVARVLREVASLEPDLVVVYTGHNEFLEERTYPALRQLPAPVKALAGALSATRTWAAMDGLMTRLGLLGGAPAGSGELLPARVDARLDHAAGLDRYERDDRLRGRILRHFEVSLERISAITRAAGAELIFVVPAANLRGCSPFKSQHTDGLTAAERDRSRRLLRAAGEHLEAAVPSAALAALDEAIGLDPRFAELHYQRGRVLFALGRHAAAKAAFERAREEDVCPLRALGEMESIVRQVAAESNSRVVELGDLLEERLLAAAGHDILGEEDFLDHVHPTIDAHRLLALALIDTMRDMGALPAGAALDGERLRAVVARVESGVGGEKRARALAALARSLEWAGKQRESERLAVRALESGIEHPTILLMAARHRVLARDAAAALDLHLRAVRADPLSPTVHYRMGLFAVQRGDLDAAAAYLLLASVLWPEDAAAHEKLGLVMAERGRFGLALASLEEARRRDPGRSRPERAIARLRLLAGPELAAPDRPGISVTRYPSGRVRSLAQTSLDAAGRTVLNGLHTEWWPSGTLRRVVGYVDGEPRNSGVSWEETGERSG